MQCQEKWLKIPKLREWMAENYYASTHGRIALKREDGKLYLLPQHLRGKYFAVGLGETIAFMVHRLILHTFIEPCPEGCEGCHADGNHRNNKLSNLRWDTHSSNIKEEFTKGRKSHKGESHPSNQLTERKVLAIRMLYRNTFRTQKEISHIYNVSRITISDVTRRYTWSHL